MREDEPKRRERTSGEGSWAIVELALGLGLRLALPLLVGVAGGSLLDRQWGSAPWFLIIGALAGVGASFYMLYDFVRRSGG